MKKGMKKGDISLTGDKLVTIILVIMLAIGFFLMIWRVFNA